jgi:hypothetical protein
MFHDHPKLCTLFGVRPFDTPDIFMHTYRVFSNYRIPSSGLSRGHPVDQVKMSSICDTLVISPAALTRHDVTRSNLSGDTSAQTCHDGEDTFFASGTNPA